MTKGYKWQLFKVDLSMIGWALLSSISFGLVGVFWSNPYTTAIDTEIYLQLRREAIRNKIEGYEELDDKLLDLDLLEELMVAETAENGGNPDIVRSLPVCTVTVPDEQENGGDE